MFRTLAMFPASAGQQQVDDVLAQTAAAFKKRPTFRGMTTNVDALMGPSAKGGGFRCLFEADFDDLDDLLGALSAESFRRWWLPPKPSSRSCSSGSAARCNRPSRRHSRYAVSCSRWKRVGCQ